MKKTGIMLLALSLVCLGLAGCGIAEYLNIQRDSTASKAQKLPEMVLNEPFKVTTVSGDYSLTINGVRTTSERNPKSESEPRQVVFLDYTYENVSYEKRNNVDFFLAQGDFVLTDEAGNIRWPSVFSLYGTTLLGMLVTESFVFSFQIGDGDISVVTKEEVSPLVEPEKFVPLG